MNNPLKTLGAHGQRLHDLEKLAVGHSGLIEQFVEALRNSVRIDLQHAQRINELEQQSAAQLSRIENLEGCIRTQAENLRLVSERVAHLEQQQRARDPFGPVFGPRPGFNPPPFSPVQWPSTLFPNGMPTFTAQQARDDADALRFMFTNLATDALARDEADITRTKQPAWVGVDMASAHQQIIADEIANGAFIQDDRAIARMSTLPVGRELTEGETPQ